jgi:transcriptional regulator with XRE-family HTH domain
MTRALSDPRYVHLIAKLRRAREGVSFSQAQLSLRLGKPQSFVAKYETGERRLDIVEVFSICAALGISLSEVLPEELRAYL